MSYNGPTGPTGLHVTTEQQQRYFTDARYHQAVDAVALSLWKTIAEFEFGQKRPYPFDWLIPQTRRDLTAYAMAAVEALEALEASRPDPNNPEGARHA